MGRKSVWIYDWEKSLYGKLVVEEIGLGGGCKVSFAM